MSKSGVRKWYPNNLSVFETNCCQVRLSDCSFCCYSFFSNNRNQKIKKYSNKDLFEFLKGQLVSYMTIWLYDICFLNKMLVVFCFARFFSSFSHYFLISRITSLIGSLMKLNMSCVLAWIDTSFVSTKFSRMVFEKCQWIFQFTPVWRFFLMSHRWSQFFDQ